MIAPDIEFQTQIRSALIASSAVTDLVPVDHIRAGSTRPDMLPCVILANPDTANLGRSGEWQITRVWLDLHVWAVEDGADMARQIGAAVANALWDAPDLVENDIDTYGRPSFKYMRDPDPEKAYCHGVATVSSVVRWRP
jgi:hypothetical protein